MHIVMYKDKDGNIVSISTWRSRVLNAREAIFLYDKLCSLAMPLIVRYENTQAVESRADLETGIIHTYLQPFRTEDGTVWFKTTIPNDS